MVFSNTKSECPWHYGIQTGATRRKRKRYVIDWGTQSKSDKWVLKMHPLWSWKMTWLPENYFRKTTFLFERIAFQWKKSWETLHDSIHDFPGLGLLILHGLSRGGISEGGMVTAQSCDPQKSLFICQQKIQLPHPIHNKSPTSNLHIISTIWTSVRHFGNCTLHFGSYYAKNTVTSACCWMRLGGRRGAPGNGKVTAGTAPGCGKAPWIGRKFGGLMAKAPDNSGRSNPGIFVEFFLAIFLGGCYWHNITHVLKNGVRFSF